MIYTNVKVIHIDSSLKLGKSVKKLISNGYSHGLTYSGTDTGEYVFATKGQQSIATVSVLELFDGIDKGVFISDIDGATYFCFIDESTVVAEICLTEHDDEKLKIIQTNLFGLTDSGRVINVLTDSIVSEANENEYKIESCILGSLLFDKSSYRIKECNSAKIQDTSELKELVVKNSLSKSLIAVGLIFTLFCGYYFYTSTVVKTEIKKTTTVIKSVVNKPNEFKEMQSRLTQTSQNPVFTLKQASKEIKRLSMLDGWNAYNLEVYSRDDNKILIKIALSSSYGTIVTLSEYAKKNGFQVNVKDDKGFLIKALEHMPILRTAAKFHIGSYQRLIANSMNAWWDNVNVEFSEIKSNQNAWSQNNVELGFKDIDSQDINSISSLLIALPLEFEKLTCHRDLNQSLRWNMSLSMNLLGVI